MYAMIIVVLQLALIALASAIIIGGRYLERLESSRPANLEGYECPYGGVTRWTLPITAGATLVLAVMALGPVLRIPNPVDWLPAETAAGASEPRPAIVSEADETDPATPPLVVVHNHLPGSDGAGMRVEGFVSDIAD